MNGDKLTLREALASDRLEDFIGQEVTEGSELLKGSELERALALLVTQRRLARVETLASSFLRLPNSSACRHGLTENSGPPHSAQRSRWARASRVESHRDFWKPTHRPDPRHAAGRAMARDVRVALSGELFEPRHGRDDIANAVAGAPVFAYSGSTYSAQQSFKDNLKLQAAYKKWARAGA
jgi:hypothetical protein